MAKRLGNKRTTVKNKNSIIDVDNNIVYIKGSKFYIKNLTVIIPLNESGDIDEIKVIDKDEEFKP